jgi:hydrogenase maturation protease
VTFADFNHPSCLIYGIGNVGRQDDGLGWALIDRLEAEGWCPRAERLANYQLQLEDADLISRKERVLFVDATKDAAVESFSLERVQPKLDFSFTSHAISIPSVMATCQQCFLRLPEVYLLAIRGYEWELQVGLTPNAQRNLDAAVAWLARRALQGSDEFSRQAVVTGGCDERAGH